MEYRLCLLVEQTTENANYVKKISFFAAKLFYKIAHLFENRSGAFVFLFLLRKGKIVIEYITRVKFSITRVFNPLGYFLPIKFLYYN